MIKSFNTWDSEESQVNEGLVNLISNALKDLIRGGSRESMVGIEQKLATLSKQVLEKDFQKLPKEASENMRNEFKSITDRFASAYDKGDQAGMDIARKKAEELTAKIEKLSAAKKEADEMTSKITNWPKGGTKDKVLAHAEAIDSDIIKASTKKQYDKFLNSIQTRMEKANKIIEPLSKNTVEKTVDASTEADDLLASAAMMGTSTSADVAEAVSNEISRSSKFGGGRSTEFGEVSSKLEKNAVEASDKTLSNLENSIKGIRNDVSKINDKIKTPFRKKVFKLFYRGALLATAITGATLYLSNKKKDEEVHAISGELDSSKIDVKNDIQKRLTTINMSSKASELCKGTTWAITQTSAPKDLVGEITDSSTLIDVITIFVDSTFKKPFDYFKDLRLKLKSNQNSTYAFAFNADAATKGLSRFISSIAEKGTKGIEEYNENGNPLKIGADQSLSISNPHLQKIIGKNAAQSDIHKLIDNSTKFSKLFNSFAASVKTGKQKADMQAFLTSDEGKTIKLVNLLDNNPSPETDSRVSNLPISSNNAQAIEILYAALAKSESPTSPFRTYFTTGGINTYSLSSSVEAMKLMVTGDESKYTIDSTILEALYTDFAADIAAEMENGGWYNSNTVSGMFGKDGQSSEVIRGIMSLNALSDFCGLVTPQTGATLTKEQIETCQSYIQQIQLFESGKTSVVVDGIYDEELDEAIKPIIELLSDEEYSGLKHEHIGVLRDHLFSLDI